MIVTRFHLLCLSSSSPVSLGLNSTFDVTINEHI